jgi:hypothetical protein
VATVSNELVSIERGGAGRGCRFGVHDILRVISFAPITGR